MAGQIERLLERDQDLTCQWLSSASRSLLEALTRSRTPASAAPDQSRRFADTFHSFYAGLTRDNPVLSASHLGDRRVQDKVISRFYYVEFSDYNVIIVTITYYWRVSDFYFGTIRMASDRTKSLHVLQLSRLFGNSGRLNMDESRYLSLSDEKDRVRDFLFSPSVEEFHRRFANKGPEGDNISDSLRSQMTTACRNYLDWIGDGKIHDVTLLGERRVGGKAMTRFFYVENINLEVCFFYVTYICRAGSFYFEHLGISTTDDQIRNLLKLDFLE